MGRETRHAEKGRLVVSLRLPRERRHLASKPKFKVHEEKIREFFILNWRVTHYRLSTSGPTTRSNPTSPSWFVSTDLYLDEQDSVEPTWHDIHSSWGKEKERIHAADCSHETTSSIRIKYTCILRAYIQPLELAANA